MALYKGMKRRLFSAIAVWFVIGWSLLWAAKPAAFKPNLGPDLKTVTVQCGEVSLLLRQASQWTMGRIDYMGNPMTTERSAYGTVFSYNGVGFIGTAHLENEPEPLVSLTFELDGKVVEHPTEMLKGDRFKLTRVSDLRGTKLTCVIEIENDRLIETTTIHAKEEVDLRLLYHFMHAWRPTVTAYLTGSDGGEIEAGAFDNEASTMRKMYINKRVDWMGIYEPDSAQFAVSRLVAAPDQGGNVSKIWAVHGNYRKYYLTCFEKAGPIPAGFSGTWKMVTAFGASSKEKWEEQARTLAAALK